MFAPLDEGFSGVAREGQHLVGRLQPAVDSGVGVVQEFVQFRLLLVQDRFLAREFLLAYFSGGTHVDERVYFPQAGVVVFLLVGEDRVAVCRLSAVLVLQPLHRPRVEFRRSVYAAERVRNLLLKLLHFEAFLAAGSLAFGAMVVGVVMHVAVFVALGLVFGRHHASALSAADHAGIREHVRLGLGFAAPAEERLNTIVLLARDHRFVLALVPVARTLRPFEPAVIERAIQHAIETASRELLEAPLIYRDLVHTRRGVSAAEQHVEHLSDDREYLRVLADRLEAFHLVGRVHISDRRRPWVPSKFSLLLQTTPHVDTFVVVLQFRLAAQEIEKEFIVRRVAVALTGRAYVLQFVLVHEIDQVSGID